MLNESEVSKKKTVSRFFVSRDSKQILLDHLKAAGLDPSILDESNVGENQELEKDEVPQFSKFKTNTSFSL